MTIKSNSKIKLIMPIKSIHPYYVLNRMNILAFKLNVKFERKKWRNLKNNLIIMWLLISWTDDLQPNEYIFRLLIYRIIIHLLYIFTGNFHLLQRNVHIATFKKPAYLQLQHRASLFTALSFHPDWWSHSWNRLKISTAKWPIPSTAQSPMFTL